MPEPLQRRRPNTTVPEAGVSRWWMVPIVVLVVVGSVFIDLAK